MNHTPLTSRCKVGAALRKGGFMALYINDIAYIYTNLHLSRLNDLILALVEIPHDNGREETRH